MEDSNYQYGSQKTKKRPEFLSVLCILTFIGSGLAAFSNLIISLNYDSLIEIFRITNYRSIYCIVCKKFKIHVIKQ